MDNKIRQIRNALNMKQKAFADSIGITDSVLSRIESNKVSLSNQVKTALEAIHNINREWLDTGKGPMFKDAGGLDRFSPAHRLLIERFTGYFAEKVPIPETEETIKAVHGFIEILMSDNEAVKKALKSSVQAFKEMLDSEKEKKKEDSPPGSKTNPRPHTKKTNTV